MDVPTYKIHTPKPALVLHLICSIRVTKHTWHGIKCNAATSAGDCSEIPVFLPENSRIAFCLVT